MRSEPKHSRRKKYQYMYDAFGRRAVLSSDAPNPLLIIFLLAGRENSRRAVATGLAGREDSRHFSCQDARRFVLEFRRRLLLARSARRLAPVSPVFHGIWNCALNCALGGILALTEYVLQNLIIRWKSPGWKSIQSLHNWLARYSRSLRRLSGFRSGQGSSFRISKETIKCCPRRILRGTQR